MGRTSMGCCFESEKVAIRISRHVGDDKYVHVEKLKSLNHSEHSRRFERVYEKALWKLNNGNDDCLVKFSLHIEENDR